MPTLLSSWMMFSSFRTRQISRKLRPCRSPRFCCFPRFFCSRLYDLNFFMELSYIWALTFSIEKDSFLAVECGVSLRALPCRILVRWSLRESLCR
jgi:hypothetical protein